MNTDAVNKKRIELAAQLRSKREDKDLSQEVLGEAVGITRIEMGRVESGQVKNIDTYIRVAHALGMDLQIRVASVPLKTTSKYE